MKKSKISIIVYYLFYLILIVGLICSIFLPTLYDMFSGISIKFREQTLIYQIAFYICYFIALLIVWTLITIFKDLYKDTPFKKEVEKKLKAIAVLFEILALIVIVKFIFIPTILTIAVFLISFIVGLCFYVLSQVFKIAIAYKDEIDFTV